MKKLIILPGWEQGKFLWEQFINKFNEGEVDVIDLPGNGKEPLVSQDWGIEEYADWTEKQLKRFGKSDIILLGHSFGGRVASLVTSRSIVKLKGLILYGSPCIRRPGRTVKYKMKLAKFLKRIWHEVPSQFNQELKKADEKGTGKIFRKAVEFDQSEELTRINCPTLLIWGKNDKEVPLRIAYEMKKLIPKSKLIILDGLSHNAHIENVNIFYGNVKKFVENI